MLAELAFVVWLTSPQASASLTGTVVDAAGRPVTHAVVALLTSTGALPADETLRRVHAVAESDGRFVIPNVPLGAHRIVVASAEELRQWPAPALVSQFSGRAFPFELTPSSSALRLVVAVGPEPDRAVSLQTVMFSRLEMVGGPAGPPPGAPSRPGATLPPVMPTMSGPGIISGVVVDESGNPVEGIHVQAGRWQSVTARSTSRLLPTGLPVVTDADGTFRIAGLSPGPYSVAALAWRFEVATLGEPSQRSHAAMTTPDGRRTAFQTTYHPATTDAVAGAVLTVEAGEIRDVRIRMQSGDVATYAVRLGEPNPNPRSYAMARLTPVSVPNQFSERNSVRALPDAEGLTVFRDVSPGTYTLSYYTSFGWVGERVVVTRDGTVADAVPHFALRPTMTLRGVVELKPTRVAPSPEALASLTVTLSQGTAASGPLLRGRVAPDGAFSITGIPGGAYSLTLVSGSSWIPVSGMVNGQDSLDAPVAMTGDVQDARLVVTDRPTTVQGDVIGAGGTRVSAGLVVVYSTDRRHWVANSTRRVRVVSVVPGGSYNVTGLPPGMYFATAFPAGTRITNTVLIAAAGDAVPFELQLGETKVVPVVVRR